MTEQTVTLAGRKFVILPEEDYRQLKAKAQARPVGKARRLTAQDRGDIAEAKRREHEPSMPVAAVSAGRTGEALERLAGAAQGLPADLAERHDHRHGRAM